VVKLSQHYPGPFFIYSAREIQRNIDEIRTAFSRHSTTRICYASKACSLLEILHVVRKTGISIEANSANEIRRCRVAGFIGAEIVYNGVVKQPDELDYAIREQVHAINVDSEYELDLINEISQRLKVVARICLRVEPNVKADTHEGLMTAFRAKSGVDLSDAHRLCGAALKMPYVKLCGLHMHVGDQVPDAAPFRDATKVLVNLAKSIEQEFQFKFEMINVGGGIPTPYRYSTDKGSGGPANMQPKMGAADFAAAVIDVVHEWRADIEICIEPGRKVVGSAALLVTHIVGKKHKTLLNEQGAVEGHVEWRMLDAGFNLVPDYKDWYYYVYNASRIDQPHQQKVKLGGPLCDGGDYFRIGPVGDQFLLPTASDVGDVVVFLDVGAYQIESQTSYNGYARTAVLLIDDDGKAILIRRQETFDDMLLLERDLAVNSNLNKESKV